MTFVTRGLIFVSLLLFTVAGNAEQALEKKLTDVINKVLPGEEVTSVSKAPIPGLYEVMLGPLILYISEDGQYVFKGDIFEMDPLENITNIRRTQARVEAFAELGSEGTIEFAPKDGKTLRTLYVYTDIDCAYCRKMHREVEQLTDAGVAVRYLAYPRTGLRGESYDKAVSVWCSKDRQQALTDAKAGKDVKSESCENPVKRHYNMGGAMGVRGTPAVYLESGDSLGGYIPAQRLIEMLGIQKG